MKIKTEALRAAFAFVNRASSKASPIDILKHARFIAKDGRFSLACNNLTMYAEANGECGAGSMSFCIRADKLGHALASAAEEVDLTLAKTVLWKSGSSRYTMAFLQAADFPVPKRDGEPTATIEDGAIVDNITRVSFACGSKGQTFNLGVGLEARSGELTATATDNHKLATLAINKGSYQDFAAIIHREVIAALPPGVTEVRIFPMRVEFIYPMGAIVASLLEAQMPDWRRIMNIQVADVVKISRGQLLAAIKATLPFDELGSVHLVMKDGVLHIEGVDRENTADHAIPATGPDLEVWFLSSMLAPPLQAVQSESIDLQFTQSEGNRGRKLLIEDGPFRCVSAPYGR